jgi:hypothetical protein
MAVEKLTAEQYVAINNGLTADIVSFATTDSKFQDHCYQPSMKQLQRLYEVKNNVDIKFFVNIAHKAYRMKNTLFLDLVPKRLPHEVYEDIARSLHDIEIEKFKVKFYNEKRK